jgi:hypothetical protein
MVCKNCGRQSEGKFCPDCGQPMEVHRITFHHLLHDVVHLFTYIESGFLYTLKMLATRAGHMQRLYMEGHRAKHQKPFSIFFICASALALAVFIFFKISQPTDETAGVYYKFLNHYFVLFHVFLLPFYAFVTWVLFKKSHYNYAEILVLAMYTSSFMFLLLIPINALNVLGYQHSTKPIEIVLLSAYNIWTFMNFFNKTSKWAVVLLSIINLVVNYVAFSELTDWAVKYVMTKE